MAKNKKSRVPHYELLYIVPNKYTEDDLVRIKTGVEKMIEANAGKITFREDWGKKKFCYPINHGRFGYYTLVEFDMESSKIEKVNTELRMDNEILRHMIVNRPAKTPEQIEAEKKHAEAKEARATKIAKSAEKKTVSKTEVKTESSVKKTSVDTKELDDKLNKILETDDLL
jgi:small subunit ribosomal protein S6